MRSNYFWSPDSKHIAYLQMDEATVPTYPITDWIPTHSTVISNAILNQAIPTLVCASESLTQTAAIRCGCEFP